MSQFTIDHIIERSTRVIVHNVFDDCGNAARIGHRGKLVGADTEHLGSPQDPYWEVEFADRKREMFWGEELKLVSEDIEANQAAQSKGGTP